MGSKNRDVLGWCFGMRLFLPKSWGDDRARCRAAGIPGTVGYQEKWKIALGFIETARAHAIPHRCTVVDTWYGDVGAFRAQLRAWKEPYVAQVTVSEIHGIPESQEVLPAGTRREGVTKGRVMTHAHLPRGVHAETAKKAAAEIRDWKEVRWGTGTKGPLEAKFARRRVRVCIRGDVPTDEVGWLLLEKGQDELKAWVCWGMDSASMEDMVRTAHLRWAIERFHEDAKMELGLDHFEGRSWRGLNHHITVELMAHTYLMLERKRQFETRKPRALPTMGEVRKEAARGVLAELLLSVSRAGTDEEFKRSVRDVVERWLRAG